MELDSRRIISPDFSTTNINQKTMNVNTQAYDSKKKHLDLSPNHYQTKLKDKIHINSEKDALIEKKKNGYYYNYKPQKNENQNNKHILKTAQCETSTPRDVSPSYNRDTKKHKNNKNEVLH